MPFAALGADLHGLAAVATGRPLGLDRLGRGPLQRDPDVGRLQLVHRDLAALTAVVAALLDPASHNDPRPALRRNLMNPKVRQHAMGFEAVQGCGVTPRIRMRRVACSITVRTWAWVPPGKSAVKKSLARIASAWERRNCDQVGPVRRRAGLMPLALRISQTVDAATLTPRPASSPWILR